MKNKFIAKYFFLLLILFSGFSSLAQTPIKEGKAYDITDVVKRVPVKDGTTKIRDFKNGFYLVVTKTKGVSTYSLMNSGGKPITPENAPQRKGKTITWHIGWCYISMTTWVGKDGQTHTYTIIICG